MQNFEALQTEANSRNKNAVKCNVKHGKNSGFWNPFSLPDNVQNKRSFNLKKDGTKSATLYGRWQVCPTGLIFVVFSYGTHFPVAIYCELSGIWYLNGGGYSVTTSRHIGRVKLALRDEKPIFLDTKSMSLILRMGENTELGYE